MSTKSVSIDGVLTTTREEIKSIQTNSQTKAQEEFRTYDLDDTPERVLQHYKDMRTYQTVEFYDRMAVKYSFENGHYRSVFALFVYFLSQLVLCKISL